MNAKWTAVSKVDVRARLLADRHYSRQTPGYREFCAPGNNIVLIIPSDDGVTARALWVSQRPDPAAALDMPRADGFDYWNNAYFRNESGLRSSDLIREAIAITRFYWHDTPRHGMHSFVDAAKVRGVKVRGHTVHGFSFMKAGFRLSPVLTSERGLLRWILSKRAIEAIEPLAPQSEQLRLFA